MRTAVLAIAFLAVLGAVMALKGETCSCVEGFVKGEVESNSIEFYAFYCFKVVHIAILTVSVCCLV